MVEITLRMLLEAGVHFGHQTSKWNPKMKKYIYTKKSGIHLFDLTKSLEEIKKAYSIISQIAETGKPILFVGTKKQAQEIVLKEAQRCGAFYVVKKWLGGTLTNFETIQKSIKKLEELNEMKEKGIFDQLPKKEATKKEKERQKLEKALEGIKEMKQLPGILVTVDPNVEIVAIKECKKKNIPIVAICDTDADPDMVDYVIPGNDDAIRSISLLFSIFADAVIEGKEKMEKKEIEAKEEILTDLGVTKEKATEAVKLE